MNTHSNAVPEFPLESQGVAPSVLTATRPMYWSIRREVWENRSIYIAPLAVAGVFLFGFLISLIGLPRRMRAALALDPAQRHHAIVMPYELAAGLIMGAALIVAIFYCLDALYGERRDRSILFWKSLPVPTSPPCCRRRAFRCFCNCSRLRLSSPRSGSCYC